MTQQPISLSGRAATEFPGEYLLGQILDHSGLLVSVKDGERRFVRVSRRLRELLTATCADPIGKTVFEVLPEPFARRVDAHDCSVFAQGRAAEFEEQLELGGVCRTLLTTRLPLFGPGGTVCGVCSISTDISERKRIEEALRNVALGVSGAPEQDIYCQIVRYLALTLRVDFAFIGILSAAMQGHVETLAIYSQGHFEENTVYPLAGTPCAQVIGGSFQFVPDHLHERYPADGMMQAFGFESYAAYPLFDSQGRLLGLIAVLDRKPMSERDVIESILRIFAVRAAVELEREQADRARQLSEASYREIFEASEDAIFIHDFDTGTILDVNPKACQAYGYTVEEMRSLDVGAISSGEPFYTLEHAIRLIEHAKVGETVRFEWHRRNKDGSLHWDEVVLKRAMLAGQPRILAFTREISERKQAEAALRASEEQYRAIFNASVDGIAFWNPDGRLVDLNPAFARMHGYSREELLRMDPQQFVHPTSWDQFQRFIETLSTGQPFHTEARSMRSDGTAFDVEVNGIPMEYQGAPHLLAIVRDISERKRAEAALRASEEQYRAIFNASVDGVTFWNAKGRLVDLNPAFARMYGYDREELLRMDPRAFIHSDSWGQFNTLLESLRTGRSYHAEARGVRRDGTVFDVEVSGVPLDYRGAPHLLAIVREITERREAERERSRLEAQLRQAQKMEAIGHLTGGIAHDFNNILTSILGYTVLALEREAAAADPRLGRYLEQIRLAGERARDLIRQMLTFSRGQRGEPRPLLLSCLIKEAVKLYRCSFPATVEFRTTLDAETPPVMLDPIQAEQVLMNLCINARDAMEGMGVIDIAVRECQQVAGVCASCRQQVAGSFVEMAVRDTGPGIAPAVLERMFEPFFTTKEVGRGSGMGLATAHGIVHEYGGHILVESAPEQGALFRVLFPATQAAVPADAADAEPRAMERGYSGRVLVVDDEASVRAFMEELLQSRGFQVRSAGDGQIALELLCCEKEPPDLVITDQTMPRLTGLALARELRVRWPLLPVILYTGHGEKLAADELREAGVATVLHKPLDVGELFAAIRELLAARAR